MIFIWSRLSAFILGVSEESDRQFVDQQVFSWVLSLIKHVKLSRYKFGDDSKCKTCFGNAVVEFSGSKQVSTQVNETIITYHTYIPYMNNQIVMGMMTYQRRNSVKTTRHRTH